MQISIETSFTEFLGSNAQPSPFCPSPLLPGLPRQGKRSSLPAIPHFQGKRKTFFNDCRGSSSRWNRFQNESSIHYNTFEQRPELLIALHQSFVVFTQSLPWMSNRRNTLTHLWNASTDALTADSYSFTVPFVTLAMIWLFAGFTDWMTSPEPCHWPVYTPGLFSESPRSFSHECCGCDMRSFWEEVIPVVQWRCLATNDLLQKSRTKWVNSIIFEWPDQSRVIKHQLIDLREPSGF